MDRLSRGRDTNASVRVDAAREGIGEVVKRNAGEHFLYASQLWLVSSQQLAE